MSRTPVNPSSTSSPIPFPPLEKADGNPNPGALGISHPIVFWDLQPLGLIKLYLFHKHLFFHHLLEYWNFPEVLPLAFSFSHQQIISGQFHPFFFFVFRTSINWPFLNLFLANYMTLGKPLIRFIFHFLLWQEWYLHHQVVIRTELLSV